MSFVAIAGLLLLPGFKKQTFTEQFPAPVEKPCIAVYANLSVSGLYDQTDAARSASREIANQVEQLCQVRSAAPAGSDNIRSATESILNDKIVTGILKVYELFFYYRDLQNFALILHGEFATSKIAGMIGADKVASNETGISTVIKLPFADKIRLHLFCKGDQLVISPENTAGNILNNLSASDNKLGPEHEAFAKMVRARPAIAADINMESLQKSYSTIAKSSWIQPLKHIRVVAASRLAKLQLFVPDSRLRENFARLVDDRFSSKDSFPGSLASFTSEINGGSIFIETPGSKELERQISCHSTAFLLHFFVRAQKPEMILSSKDTHEQ